MTETEVLAHAFCHFYHLDHSNAAVHCARVRYSPITFRLAELISQRGTDHLEQVPVEVFKVMNDLGAYEEDPGR